MSPRLLVALLVLASAAASAQEQKTTIEGNEFGGKTLVTKNPDGGYVEREELLYDKDGKLRRKVEQYALSTRKEEPCTLAVFDFGADGTVKFLERFFNLHFISDNEGLYKENLTLERDRILRRDLWFLDSPVNAKRVKHISLVYGANGDVREKKTENYGGR